MMKSMSSDIKMATLACFIGPFAYSIFFYHFFPSEVMSIFDVKVCFLDAAEGWALFFNPFCYSVSFYWGVGTIVVGSL